jgi:two-component system cell cycle sensor histidine kinase/response regulator CckA
VTAPPARAITVLLVEDNPGDARLILELLRHVEAGDFALERVDRLEPALERLKHAGVDAVLLDLGLPDSQGIETFARAQREAPGEPIVVISGLDDERVALEAVRLGAQDYLVKGRIDGQLLARVIRYAIERKRAEVALAASEAHYRTILENVVDAVFVMDSAGRYVDVNPSACDLTGHTREELLRHRVAETWVTEERRAVSERLAELSARRQVSFERRLLRKDGGVILVEGNAVRLPNGRSLMTLRDITERREADEQIRESERRFRELAESVREVFFVVEPGTGRVLYVNPAYEEVFGHSREHAYSTPNAWSEGIHPEDREEALAAEREAARTGEYQAAVYRIVRPDGATRWIRGRATPVRDEAGRIIRLVGVAEDISDLKRTEEQFRQAQKMEAVGRLAGGVAHDFNNLLTAILGYAELLLQDLAPESEHRMDVVEIRTAAQRAARLTGQLLAFSRQQVLQLTVLSVNDVVKNLEKLLRRLIGEDVILHTRLAPDAGNVRADAGQLEQVIVNLAVNARDAMAAGGTLTIETANAELTEAYIEAHQPAAGPYIMLAVTDTGAGISPENRSRIFEPFFTTKEQGKGTGLGLSTVYGIVKQSGGYIWVYSEPGRGATFKLYLPRVDAPVESPAPGRPTEGTPLGTETVLLAEDDEQLRKLVRGFLERVGYRVLAAASAAEALGQAREHEGPVHLLLTDVVMPGQSGRELAGLLAETRPEIRTLFMSGYTDAAIMDQGILERGLEYLQKPFTPAVLARRVRDVLDAE